MGKRVSVIKQSRRRLPFQSSVQMREDDLVQEVPTGWYTGL